jgi:hypothetical protein
MRHAIRLSLPAAALAAGVMGGAPALGQWEQVVSPRDAMQEGYMQVVGISEEGQSHFKAVRAATVVAQRDLLESFQGLTIAGKTTIRDGMLANDTVASEVKGFLRGAVKCGERYHPERGYAEVCMRLYIRGRGGAYDIILPLLAREGVLESAAPEGPRYVPEVVDRPRERPQAVTTPPQAIAAPPEVPEPPEAVPEVAPPSALAHPSDGLIIDLEGMGFKPAIVNRILTDKGEVVFGPSRVVNTVLVERGCGGFTNQSEKARGLLATWGSENPLTIRATGVHEGTDAVVDPDTAAAIFTHDQRTSFLSQAKVVFLIH